MPRTPLDVFLPVPRPRHGNTPRRPGRCPPRLPCTEKKHVSRVSERRNNTCQLADVRLCSHTCTRADPCDLRHSYCCTYRTNFLRGCKRGRRPKGRETERGGMERDAQAPFSRAGRRRPLSRPPSPPPDNHARADGGAVTCSHGISDPGDRQSSHTRRRIPALGHGWDIPWEQLTIARALPDRRTFSTGLST